MPLMYSRDLLLPCVSMLISIGRLYATPNYRRNLVPVFFCVCFVVVCTAESGCLSLIR